MGITDDIIESGIMEASIDELIWAIKQSEKVLRKLHDAKVTLDSIKGPLQEDNQRMLNALIDLLNSRHFLIENRMSFIGGFE